MEHSSAYIDFKKQLKETGKQKLDGYYPDLLYCINADERKEIEKDIWTYFVKKDDAGLAIFMPYLEDYDGIGALKKKLSAFKVPSSVSADIALALFDVTEDKQYLDIIMDNYRGLAVNTPIAAGLARLAKKPGVYDRNPVCKPRPSLLARGITRPAEHKFKACGHAARSFLNEDLDSFYL